MCSTCRDIAFNGKGDMQKLGSLCVTAVHAQNGLRCMCIPYARVCVALLASKMCTQRYAEIVLRAWPTAGAECVFAAMADGNHVTLRWLLEQQPSPDFSWYVSFCNRQPLQHRIRYSEPVMLLLVQHGWCPWASANPGVSLEVLQTATWAARKKYVGVHPDVMAFLPMCTMPGCDANHGVFDRRVLQATKEEKEDMLDWDSEDLY